MNFLKTAYTKPHPDNTGHLCYECALSFGIDPLVKTKKRAVKKPVAKKDKRAKVISYEEIMGPLPLGDLCIKVSQSVRYGWDGTSHLIVDDTLHRIFLTVDWKVYRGYRGVGEHWIKVDGQGVQDHLEE